MLDIYWKFAESGDHYLGSILAGLYPCSVDFGVLLPHFIVPYDDPLMQEGLNLCFGKNMRLKLQEQEIEIHLLRIYLVGAFHT